MGIVVIIFSFLFVGAGLPCGSLGLGLFPLALGSFQAESFPLKLNLLVVNQKLVETLARGNHWQDRDLLVDNDLNEDGALIVVKHLLQTTLEFLKVFDANTLETHGVGKLHKVRVLLMSVGISVVVEERLPLRNHTLLLIVENDNLDIDAVLHGTRQLSQSHVEGSITVNVDDNGVRGTSLGTNSSGQTETHGTQTTGRNHTAGVLELEELGSPHLMLADTSGHDDLVLDGLTKLGKLGDDSLGLDGLTAVGNVTLIVKGVLLLPLGDSAEPLGSLLDSLNQGQQLGKVLGNITLDSLGGLDNLVDVLGQDFKVDDTTALLKSSQTSGRSKLGNVASDTLVKAGTESNDDIGVLHSHVGVARTVHTQHSQGLFFSLVVSTETVQSGGDGDLGLVGQLAQENGALLRVHDTVANVKNGLLGLVDEVSGALDGLVLELRDGSSGQRLDGLRGNSGVCGNSIAENGRGNVLGKIDKDRARAARAGNLKGLIDAARQLGNVLDHDVPLGAGTGDADNVSLLESVGTNGSSGNLTGEDNHGDTVGKGVLHGGDDVGGTRTRGNNDDTGLAGGLCVALGHVAGTLLVSRHDELEVRRVVDAIENGENGTARVTENGVDIVAEHHLVEDLATGETNESGGGLVIRVAKGITFNRKKKAGIVQT